VSHPDHAYYGHGQGVTMVRVWPKSGPACKHTHRHIL